MPERFDTARRLTHWWRSSALRRAAHRRSHHSCVARARARARALAMLLRVARANARLYVQQSVRSSSRAFSAPASNEEQVEIEFRVPFLGHRCTVPESRGMTSKDEMMNYYEVMQKCRRMEIVSDNLYKQRLIRGFCHLYDGQEAVAVGMYSALEKNDYTITAYRDHCHQLLTGDSLESIMAELLGKKTGCSRGKGGSMHLYNTKGNFFGGNGIVGAQIPLGAGLALASSYRNSGQVAVAMYGDGASNQGQLFEAANMASLWKLPIIFMCENNQYGMGTPTSRSSSNENFYTRGDHIPGIQVDGMNVLACRDGVRFAAEHCRAGNGPMFMEMKTYRYHGHSMSDPGISYRSRDEVSEVRAQRDCITQVKKLIIEQQWATDAELKAIDKSVKKEVDAAVKFAKSSSELSPEELYTDIVESGPPKFVRYPDLANSKHN